jgi:hypothetical protein
LEEQRSSGSTSLPADELALAAVALANGLSFEEVSDPGSVPEPLLGQLLTALVSR